jgi:fructoselysine 6-kinase
MTKIACIGDISIDFYVNQERYFIGGISFNVASNLSNLNIEATICSAIGEDYAGKLISEYLDSKGFNSHLLKYPTNTALQRILIKTDGERKFDGYSAGALKRLAENFTLDTFPLRDFDIIHVPLSDGMEDIFYKIAASSISAIKIADFSIDAEVGENISNVLIKHSSNFDIIFIGGNKSLETDICDLSIKYPEKIFVLTLGKDGSKCFHNRDILFQEALISADTVDTTGCGDSFQAGFIASWLKNKSNLQQALFNGASCAAKIATQLGSSSCEILNTQVLSI